LKADLRAADRVPGQPSVSRTGPGGRAAARRARPEPSKP